MEVDERVGTHGLDNLDGGREPRAVGPGRLALGPVHVLGPDAQEHVAAAVAGVARRPLRRQGEGMVTGPHRGRTARRLEPCRGKIHRRRADEARDEAGRWPLVELQRRPLLFDLAVAQQHNPVGERHRLHLVVGHVDHGPLHVLMQPLDLGAHLVAQLGVEVAERLVEEIELGVPHQRAAHGDALALAAGELARLALEQVRDAQHGGSTLHPRADLGIRRVPHPEPEGHVLEHRHMRIERVVLKHHRDVPVLGPDVVDHRAIDLHRAFGHNLQACDHAQERALAAPRRPHQHGEGAVRYLDIHTAHGMNLAVALVHAAQPDSGHRAPPTP